MTLNNALHRTSHKVRRPVNADVGIGESMKKITLLVLLMLATAAPSFASEIVRITLAELQAKADIVVLAKVTKVVAEGDADHVTIKVDSFLKGKGPRNIYTFTLVTRGGLKDFDPSIKEGDSGVFFLKPMAQEGEVEKAYWGGVAVFPKNNFDLTNRDKESQQSGPAYPPQGVGSADP